MLKLDANPYLNRNYFLKRKDRIKKHTNAPRLQARLRVFILMGRDSGSVRLEGGLGADAARVGRAGQVPMEETPHGRNNRFSNPKSMLILVACICFAVAVLETAGFLSINKVDWTNLGLLFGFLSFIV